MLTSSANQRDVGNLGPVGDAGSRGLSIRAGLRAGSMSVQHNRLSLSRRLGAALRIRANVKAGGYD